MSRRTNTTKRLERRVEREAKRPGNAPRAQRARQRPTAVKAKGGFLSSIPMTGVLIGLGAVVVIGIVLYAVLQANEGPATGPTAWQKAMLDSDPKLPGTYIPPHPGKDGRLCTDASCIASMDDRSHVAEKIPICTQQQINENKIYDPLCYTSNPPTSGPHNASPTEVKILDNPAPRESLVHNMEHGAVVVWYNTTNQDVLNQLKQVVRDALDRRRMVIMTQYTDMEPDTIAVTAWTRIDKFKTSEFTAKRVADFIQEHQRRFNPEGF